MPLFFLTLIWLGYFFQNLGWIGDCQGGIIPLYAEGLKGIIFSPFLHGSLDHIIGNSIPLAVFSFLIYEFYPKVADKVMLQAWLFSGLAVWLTPPIDFFESHTHYIPCIIGASGVIYVQAFFLFVSGIVRWTVKLMSISLLVALYYGGMIWGMIPEELLFSLSEPSKVAWQSHLAGGVIGVILAIIYRHQSEKRKKYIWEYPNYYNEKDDLLWQKYKAEYPGDFNELPHTQEDEIWDYLEELRKREK
ncbi:rhomboid family intramembrane serine protease [Elizabethkingia sp. JS20170427COW]|uniref:rhomboid family intramembrane serine protease n=1 Tax=Elizabethkingia sp. JS20170427COW TaxID=2583851 RepID=UPI001110342C|nr:rhomboid family intramembrane serine protease [Elizabethkingia sp. JS20170427COW]QCX54464.1 rhomboid family intramembrane serine protease [Elizabethkingia sp. JS20170427COW]